MLISESVSYATVSSSSNRVWGGGVGWCVFVTVFFFVRVFFYYYLCATAVTQCSIQTGAFFPLSDTSQRVVAGDIHRGHISNHTVNSII